MRVLCWVRYRRGDRLVPVGDWVVSFGPDRYLQTVWCCGQGATFYSARRPEQEVRGIELSLPPHTCHFPLPEPSYLLTPSSSHEGFSSFSFWIFLLFYIPLLDVHSLCALHDLTTDRSFFLYAIRLLIIHILYRGLPLCGC